MSPWRCHGTAARLEEALRLIHFVAAGDRAFAAPEIHGRRTRFAGSGGQPAGEWTDDNDLPGFLEKAGVTCAAWRARRRRALCFRLPLAWTDQKCVIAGMPCLIKHSLSPCGPGRILGILQYFPLELRALRADPARHTGPCHRRLRPRCGEPFFSYGDGGAVCVPAGVFFGVVKHHQQRLVVCSPYI